MHPLKFFHCMKTIPANVPPEVTRNVLKGNVNCRKPWYLADAAVTPISPIAAPAKPPMMPPWRVCLGQRVSLVKGHGVGPISDTHL